MNQLTFEAFIEDNGKSARKDSVTNPYTHYVPVLVHKDLNIAWTDRNWFLHDQDIIYLDPRLASLLVERGIARKTEVS